MTASLSKVATRRVRRAHRQGIDLTMRPVRTAHPTRVGPQNGYILLPVVLLITLISVVAFLLNHESALGTGITGSNAEADRAEYIARAGMAHATWGAQNSGCAGDMGMTTVPFGQGGIGSYTATVTSPGGSTTAYSLSADQDAWFRSDNPTVNNGTTADMHLRMESGQLEYALYRFDLSSLPAGSQINSASAWLYVTNSGPGGGAFPEGPLTVHRVTADWTETGATWETMNTNYDSTVIATVPAQPQDEVWVQINLTAQVQAWLNGGDPNFGIMLRPNGEGTHGKLVSREGASSQQPRLDVIVGSGPASPMTIGATGTLIGNPTPANDITRSLTRTAVPAYQPPGYALLQLQPGSGKDAMLSGFYNAKNYGDHRLRVSSAAGSPRNSTVQFDVPALPVGARVISAQLQLYHTATTTAGADAGVTVHRVRRDWVEGTKSGGGTADGVTWDTWDGSNAWTTAGGDYDPAAFASSSITAASGDWESWDITALAQGWLDGTFVNSGLLLKGSGNVNVDFASKENADPALHPKLILTYACECGQACVAPQGSGNILMVVSDEWFMTADEKTKKALFESWGYTVDLISQWDVSWNFDAKAANNDVVYVSEAVNSNTFGMAPKLAATTLGVVNEEGGLNDELGMAVGLTWPVGNSFSITDTSHYITQPFAAGSLPILSAPMEGLTVSGSEAGGLQTLADWGTAGSLVVLETGAVLEGGGSAPGRRVMLPLGRDQNFNPDYLNNNGRLIVQRAIAWGMKADVVSIGNVLMVVGNPGNLTAQEGTKKALIESWDFTVNLIDESDSQANFDTAIAANDVAYISQDINSTNLGTKLANASIGVVNEEGEQVDELGFSQTKLFKSRHEIDVVDNSHYITQPFATGLLTFVSSDQSVHMLSSSQAPGLQALGKSFNTGSLWEPSLAVIDTGGDLWGGGTAAGRRVELPWGGGTFDTNLLTDEGRTIMRRAIEWGAGIETSATGPLAHWKLDETSGNTAVDSLGGHDGTLINGPTWGAGQLDGALSFDGNNDYINVPHDDTLSLTTFSISAWIQPTALSGWQIVVSKSNSTSWNYYLGTSGSEIALGFNNSGSWTEFITSGAGLSTGQWYHLAGTFDDATGEGKVYLNGALIHTGTTTASPPATSDAVTIGKSAAGEYWSGRLDDIRLFDRRLSAAEIAELAAPPPLLPIAHWKLDDGTGLTAIDSEGGHDGALANGPSWATGQDNGALDFDGTDDYVDLTSDAELDDLFVGGATVMAWIYPRSWGESVNGRILDKTSEISGDRDGWMIAVKGDTPAIQFAQGFTGVRGFWRSQSGTVALNAWVHVAVVYDASSDANDAEIYLDGVKQSPLVEITPSGTIRSDASISLRMGNWAQDTTRTFDGIIDDVRIYDRMLSAAEIADTANGGGGGGGGGPSIEPPGACNGTFRDEFNIQQYDQNDGSLTWATNWTETGETTSPTGGDILITSENDTYELTVRDDGQTVWREADLSQAGAATLSFDYWRRNLSGSADYVAVEVSYNGGSSWTELDRFTGTADDDAFTSTSYVLDAGSLSANTRIRFLTPSSGMSNSNQVRFDNIQIECSP
ncbi:MAG: LamG-like jellyroll fold domain-containing protein [Thiogranum sp.]